MTTLATVIGKGAIGSRPAAASAGRLYFSTEPKTYRDNGSSWDDVSDAGTGFANPMTTAEDIIYGGASGAPTRKAVGSNGTFLGVTAGAIGYTAVTDALLSTSDITTNNASTSKHGFLKKLSNSATDYMDGTGNWSTPAGGGGGSSSYLGYNTVGGSAETITNNRMHAKKITTSGAVTAQSLDIHMKELTDSTGAIHAIIWADNAGAIGDIIATGRSGNLAPTNTSGFASNYRWMSISIGIALAASTDYWIGFQVGAAGLAGSAPSYSIHYDTSGSDRRFDATDFYITDGGRFSETDTTRKYSMRLLVF